MKADWKTREKAILKWAQKRLQMEDPLGEPFKQHMRHSYLKLGHEDDGINDYEDGVRDFVEKALMIGHFSPVTRETTGKVNAKCLNRRLHLVEFVILEHLGMQNWLGRSFKARKRIDWVKTSAAWNETHPLDAMTPPVLKATYYRAIAQRDLQRKFFDKHMDLKLREFLKRNKTGGTLVGMEALDWLQKHVDPSFLKVTVKKTIADDAGKISTVIDARGNNEGTHKGTRQELGGCG